MFPQLKDITSYIEADENKRAARHTILEIWKIEQREYSNSFPKRKENDLQRMKNQCGFRLTNGNTRN